MGKHFKTGIFLWFLVTANAFRVSPGLNFYSPAVGLPWEKLLWLSSGGFVDNSRNVEVTNLNSTGAWLTEPTFSVEINASVSAAPAISGNAIVFPTLDGRLVAVHGTTGATLWEADVGVAYLGESVPGRSVIKTTPVFWRNNHVLVGTSNPAKVLTINVLDGSLLWGTELDAHPWSGVSGSGTVFENSFYVGISSAELYAAETVENYTCCTFVGSLVSLDLVSQSISWKTRTIGPNISGVGGFSGAPLVGGNPPVHEGLRMVFVATGKNYASPSTYDDCVAATLPEEAYDSCVVANFTTNYANSVLGLDVDTGTVLWRAYLQDYVAWRLACLRPYPVPNCPSYPGGTIYDFGMMPTLGEVPPHVPEEPAPPPIPTRRKRSARADLWPVVFVGQKSGILWCLKAEDGSLVWANQTSPPGYRGGLNTGLAVDENNVYVSVSNSNSDPWQLSNASFSCGGGWAAHNKTNGWAVWTTANPAAWDPSGPYGDPGSNGRSSTATGGGAPASLGAVVLATSGDTVYVPDYGSGVPTYGSGGYVYALNKTDGGILASYETGAGGVSSFSGNERCAYVGSGYREEAGYAVGKYVYAWCNL